MKKRRPTAADRDLADLLVSFPGGKYDVFIQDTTGFRPIEKLEGSWNYTVPGQPFGKDRCITVIVPKDKVP